MAGDGVRDSQEISRRIRDELERIRDAEGRVEEALETVRQARRRVEVVARELAREEERVRAWVREEIKATSGGGAAPPTSGGEAASAPDAAADAAPRSSWRSDPRQGWATWREAPAPVRDAISASPTAPATPAAPAARAASPAAETSTATPAGPAVPLAPGASAEPRRPAALDPEFEEPVFRTAPVPATTASSPGPDRRASWTRAGLGALAALAVALIGWFAIGGLRRDSAPTEPVVAAEQAPAVAPGPTPSPVEPAPVVEQPAADPSPLAVLPTDPAARQALYDSLFAAQSPLFEPLLAQVQSETSERGVRRALDSWREGPVDAQDADLVHSALLQHVLKAAIDPRIEIDGQVLRNPCRGRSCTAILTAWQQKPTEYGLPPVPANAATDPRALRQAEAALVLIWLKEPGAPAAATP